ncbi:MAG: hypothetical protein WCO84_03405 [bacterium]
MINASEIILKILKESAQVTLELSEMMIHSRSESYRLFRESLHGNSKGEKKGGVKPISKQNFYNLLNYLKREGFVHKDNKDNDSVWSITDLGIKKLERIRLRALNSKNNINYKVEKTDKSIIVAFDIPEKYGKHRAWLREVLGYLDFNMAQKSLWIGTSKIPEEFIFDLKNRGLVDHVDIFELGAKGTLQRMNLKEGATAK